MATVEKMPMLQEGYEKLSAELKRLKAERPLIDRVEGHAQHLAERELALPCDACFAVIRQPDL